MVLSDVLVDITAVKTLGAVSLAGAMEHPTQMLTAGQGVEASTMVATVTFEVI
jgi:hypothetical protein